MNLEELSIYNSECFDEERTPKNPINELRRISYEPELFQKINSESGKTDITTLIATGIGLAELIGITTMAYIAGNQIINFFYN